MCEIYHMYALMSYSRHNCLDLEKATVESLDRHRKLSEKIENFLFDRPMFKASSSRQNSRPSSRLELEITSSMLVLRVSTLFLINLLPFLASFLHYLHAFLHLYFPNLKKKCLPFLHFYFLLHEY